MVWFVFAVAETPSISVPARMTVTGCAGAGSAPGATPRSRPTTTAAHRRPCIPGLLLELTACTPGHFAGADSLNTFPSFITKTTRSRTFTSLRGSPLTATTSASAPGAMTPS